MMTDIGDHAVLNDYTIVRNIPEARPVGALVGVGLTIEAAVGAEAKVRVGLRIEIYVRVGAEATVRVRLRIEIYIRVGAEATVRVGLRTDVRAGVTATAGVTVGIAVVVVVSSVDRIVIARINIVVLIGTTIFPVVVAVVIVVVVALNVLLLVDMTAIVITIISLVEAIVENDMNIIFMIKIIESDMIMNVVFMIRIIPTVPVDMALAVAAQPLITDHLYVIFLYLVLAQPSPYRFIVVKADHRCVSLTLNMHARVSASVAMLCSLLRKWWCRHNVLMTCVTLLRSWRC